MHVSTRLGLFPQRPQPGWREALRSSTFHHVFTFDGELGAIYTPQSTLLRLWAPTAENVQAETSRGVFPMSAGPQGTWEVRLDGDHSGTSYLYKLDFADGTSTTSIDPYARASTANSEKSVILDPAKVQLPAGQGERMPAFTSPQDAIISEAHIRDLTIAPDNGIEHKGKYLGLTERGTRTEAGNLSGLDYLISLGITHVQFLPMFDFGSVDETGDLSYGAQYNWGYDPVNFNVPEGSYATDPADPEARIREMKQMIQALHEAGLRVIMDVVYNHVYDADASPFERTVPGYYFRLAEDGSYRDGTGVGNETASEQPMMRKYIVDSVRYWASEYNIDGFRFDLMGIHDVVTMNAVRAALDGIDPSIIIIGEGWPMGHHPAGVTASNYFHASQMDRISHFNDEFRDVVKGDNFTLSGRGFVTGDSNPHLAERLYTGITGARNTRDYSAPSQSVIYNEAHDNFTMFDKIRTLLPHASEDELERRQIIAIVLQYISNGVLFIHAGQEFLRTKAGNHNSYNSPDHVNAFEYDRVGRFPAAVTAFRMLNRLRSSWDWAKLETYSEIESTYQLLAAESSRLAYRIVGDEVGVVINASEQPWTVDFLPDGGYCIVAANARYLAPEESDSSGVLVPMASVISSVSEAVSGGEPPETQPLVVSGELSIPPLTFLILQRI